MAPFKGNLIDDSRWPMSIPPRATPVSPCILDRWHTILTSCVGIVNHGVLNEVFFVSTNDCLPLTEKTLTDSARSTNVDSGHPAVAGGLGPG